MTSTGAPPPPQPPPSQPPRSNTKRTLIIVFSILGLVGVVFCIASAYVVYRLKNSQMGQSIGEVVEAAAQAEKAPGAQELRASGCKRAQVMDMRKFIQAALEAQDAGADVTLTDDDLPGLQVICHVDEGSPLGCDDVAQTYVQAAKPGSSFTVAVLPGREPLCTEHYSSAGERLQMDYEGEDAEPVDPDPAPPAE